MLRWRAHQTPHDRSFMNPRSPLFLALAGLLLVACGGDRTDDPSAASGVSTAGPTGASASGAPSADVSGTPGDADATTDGSALGSGAGSASVESGPSGTGAGPESGGQGSGSGEPTGSGEGSEPSPGGSSAAPACAPIAAPVADWYAAPDGQVGAAGTRADPLPLALLFSTQGPVAPGERVHLLGGTYAGHFEVTVAGTSAAPVVFAAAPGERAILDSNVPGEAEGGLILRGGNVEVHDLVVTSTSPVRGQRQSGVVIYGPRTRLINSVVHDTAQGVSFWTPAVDAELYGNIIYHNGFTGPTRGHGHAIYTQNREGTKRIARNILFFGYGTGLHAYTEGGHLQGFDIVENVWFRTGASVPGSSTVGESDGCLVGGLQPVARARLVGNLSWGPAPHSRSLRVGWGGSVQNEDITLIDNFLVGHFSAQGHWRSGTIHGNAFHGTIVGMEPEVYPDNDYAEALPTTNRSVVHVNAHDPGRAELVVYNPEGLEEVEVPLADVLPVGAEYTLHSVMDLFGSPLRSGTFAGGSLRVPMGTLPPVQALGDPASIEGADDPGAAFGVFVLRSRCALWEPEERER
ncbi:MAG: hypothetical protein EA398_11660 [Deltaproteobacteria bacterium]|nr:MAG: hypothetical protein EA398_11660 [Deltaproteobacteria bacterium]